METDEQKLSELQKRKAEFQEKIKGLGNDFFLIYGYAKQLESVEAEIHKLENFAIKL